MCGIAGSWSTKSQRGQTRGIDTVLKLPETGCEYVGYTPDEPLRVRQLHDVTNMSLPTLLRYEDRDSMGNSVESRYRFWTTSSWKLPWRYLTQSNSVVASGNGS